MMARICTGPSLDFDTGGPDCFGLYYGYYPQGISLHTEYAPGQLPGRDTRYDTALPILARAMKGGDANIT